MAPYMEKSEKITIELPDYFHDILESDIMFSVIPDIDIQKAAGRLIDERELILHCLSLKCLKRRVLLKCQGWPCSVDKVFTGHTLDRKESVIVQVLEKKPGKNTHSHMWEKER